MVIKLAIIAAVLLAGGVLFSGEIAEMFPKSTGTFSGIGGDIAGMTESALHGIETKIGGGIGDVNAKLDELAESSASYVAENIGDRLPGIEAPQVLAGAEPQS